MKATFIDFVWRTGNVSVWLPDPVASSEQVIVDIIAASVNAADWKVRLGEYQHTKLPLIPGRDFSEVVGATGEGANDIAVGDQVFGVCEVGQVRSWSGRHLRGEDRRQGCDPRQEAERSIT